MLKFSRSIDLHDCNQSQYSALIDDLRIDLPLSRPGMPNRRSGLNGRSPSSRRLLGYDMTELSGLA